MVVDYVVHLPERESGGIPNPHFHFMYPIQSIENNGKWGNKQHREYVLDETGGCIPDGKGCYVFNAVPATDWEDRKLWRNGEKPGPMSATPNLQKRGWMFGSTTVPSPPRGSTGFPSSTKGLPSARWMPVELQRTKEI